MGVLYYQRDIHYIYILNHRTVKWAPCHFAQMPVLRSAWTCGRRNRVSILCAWRSWRVSWRSGEGGDGGWGSSTGGLNSKNLLMFEHVEVSYLHHPRETFHGSTYQNFTGFFWVFCAQSGLKFKCGKAELSAIRDGSNTTGVLVKVWGSSLGLCRQGKYEISQNLTKQLILSNKDPKVRAMADQMPTTMHTFTEVCIHSQALLVWDLSNTSNTWARLHQSGALFPFCETFDVQRLIAFATRCSKATELMPGYAISVWYR